MDEIFPNPRELALMADDMRNNFQERCIEFYLQHPLLAGIYVSVNNILK